MAMRKTQHFPLALGTALALLTGPMALAQTTTPTPAAPVAEPGAVQKPAAPLKNPLNRNPTRRALPPDNSIPPPDPRDSTSRPTLPPVSSDGRDTVLPPEAPASDARRP